MTERSSPVWGNVARPVISEHDSWIDPANGFCWNYDYIAQYCMAWQAQACTHPGWDIGMPYGTTLYAPVAGKITCTGTGKGAGYDNGGCAAYTDTKGGAGRIELLLDDGSVIIFGHASEALAPLGSHVEAGAAIARSGYQNSDHLHYEYRVPNTNCGLGYAIVTPFQIPEGPAVHVPFRIGDRIRVADPDGLHLRTEAGLSAPSTVTTTLPDGTKMDVLDGPTEKNDLHWYQVQIASGAGWGWRAIGPTTVDVWKYELKNISQSGSPMLPGAEACHAAAGDHSALALAMAWVEQKYGTYQNVIPASAHNPMSLRDPAGGWQQFPTYADGIAAWFRLLTDPDGPYAGTKTVAELIHVYAPDWDPDLPPGASQEAKYVADIESLIARFRALEGTTQAAVASAETGYVAGEFCRLVNRFQVGDQIHVVDGPLNIRQQPSAASSTVSSYLTGTEICVREGPTFAEGHEWYRVDGYGLAGWVAGEYCGILTAGGCQ